MSGDSFLTAMQRKRRPPKAAPTMCERIKMRTPLQSSIPDNPPETLVVFDLRVPGTGSGMRREVHAWKPCVSIERLDQNHAVLIVRPGGARRLVK